MSENYLFGDPGPRIIGGTGERRKKVGTAAPVGSGPDGEFCRTCRHAVKVPSNCTAFYKCELMEHHWTHGAGTDIKLKYAACREWEGK